MAGLKLFELFPALKAASPNGLHYATGVFQEAKPEEKRQKDLTWMAAAPIANSGGKAEAFLVTGWSYRRFAYHLQEHLKGELKSTQMQSGDLGKLPIVYIAVFDGDEVFSAPQTPAVNEETMKKLNPAEKAKGGVTSGILELEGRAFGWAAALAPDWGEKRGVVLLRSEI
jgi:hypothetical protein